MKKISLRELQLLQLDAMKYLDAFCTRNGINYYMIGGTLLGAVRHNGFIPWDDDIDIAMLRSDYEKFVRLLSREIDDSKYFLQNYDTEKEFQPALSRLCIKGTFMEYPSEKHLNICKNTYIDIFPLDNVPDDELLREKQCTELSKVDKLFQYRIGRVFDSGIFNYKKIVKGVIRQIMRLYPIAKLKSRRVQIMTMYADVDTECVCSTVSQYGYKKQIMKRCIYGTPQRLKFEDCELLAPEKYDEYLTHLFGKNYMQIPPEHKRVKPHDAYLID